MVYSAEALNSVSLRHETPVSGDVEGEVDLRNQAHSLEDIYSYWASQVSAEELDNVLKPLATELHSDVPDSDDALNKRLLAYARAKKMSIPKKSHILEAYESLVAEGTLSPKPDLRGRLMSKAMKSQSGVISITVVTSPYPVGEDGVAQPFSCKFDCFYCPNQPGQPRSYLRDEPAVLRANQSQFDPILQFTDRAVCLARNGHPVDKVEVLVLGGTWSNYPAIYKEAFVRDLFYAANCFRVRDPALRRERLSLAEEQAANEAAVCKVIGLTLETRPDTITPAELVELRRLGCTRVQVGLQHTDDGILRHINRGHDAQASADALKLLKDACFKIDIHLMPNLPGATPDLDTQMLIEVFQTEDYQADQVKLYPCETTPFTKIAEWYAEGQYTPYSDADLMEVLVAGKAAVPPWIRLNRVVRDIPAKYIRAGLQETNFREAVLAELLRRGSRCKCIRCREAGDLGGRQEATGGAKPKPRDGVSSGARAERLLLNDSELVVRQYPASGGTEYFISYETEDRQTLFGFCRLRITSREGTPSDCMPILNGAGLIRELHVYGQLVATEQHSESHAQNVGLGRLLLAEAEQLALSKGCARACVISGVGARGYYRKLGYDLDDSPDGGAFMVKELSAATLLPRGSGGLRKRGTGQSRSAIAGTMKSQFGKLPSWWTVSLAEAPELIGWVAAVSSVILAVVGIYTLLQYSQSDHLPF